MLLSLVMTLIEQATSDTYDFLVCVYQEFHIYISENPEKKGLSDIVKLEEYLFRKRKGQKGKIKGNILDVRKYNRDKNRVKEKGKC